MTNQPNRIALVTGANRGIGYEICRQLARLNIMVILASRDPAKGESASQALRSEGLKVVSHPLDVSSESSVEAIRAWIEREYGRLDILINNAGVYLDEGMSVFDVPFDTFRETFEINLFGAFLTCKAFVPMMRRQNYGRVVNVSSGYGSFSGLGGYTAAYRLSKVSLNALTRIVAAETRRYNIKVNTMDPGWVKTDMGGRGAPRTVDQGADTAIYLATLPDDGATDGFFRDRRRVEW